MSLHFNCRWSTGRWLKVLVSSHMKNITKWHNISLAPDALWARKYLHTEQNKFVPYLAASNWSNIEKKNTIGIQSAEIVRSTKVLYQLHWQAWSTEAHKHILIPYKIQAYTYFDKVLSINVNGSALTLLRNSLLLWQTFKIYSGLGCIIRSVEPDLVS